MLSLKMLWRNHMCKRKKEAKLRYPLNHNLWGEEDNLRSWHIGVGCTGACGSSYILAYVKEATRKVYRLYGTYDKTHWFLAFFIWGHNFQICVGRCHGGGLWLHHEEKCMGGGVEMREQVSFWFQMDIQSETCSQWQYWKLQGYIYFQRLLSK